MHEIMGLSRFSCKARISSDAACANGAMFDAASPATGALASISEPPYRIGVGGSILVAIRR
jgi:hypothetical protein